MFQGKTIFEILRVGGFTMYILLFCSFLSVMIILERILYYRRLSRTDRREFMVMIGRSLKSGRIDTARAICQNTMAPFSQVVSSGLELHGRPEKEMSIQCHGKGDHDRNLRSGAIYWHCGHDRKQAVYIGLFGTVLGIIRAFHDISVAGAGGMSIVIGGVAEALVCTATGLAVAIPAVIAYNYFSKRVERFIDDMELCASELLDFIRVE